ncbi:GDSL-like Lipase/Acylhydrolase-domain-containing protein [Paraphysoderma sedebokerense]|nr:GDSL-like Lipase/Acylhydrolase-domain-containing protein [Paraphysoderma sedebokerense]
MFGVKAPTDDLFPGSMSTGLPMRLLHEIQLREHTLSKRKKNIPSISNVLSCTRPRRHPSCFFEPSLFALVSPFAWPVPSSLKKTLLTGKNLPQSQPLYRSETWTDTGNVYNNLSSKSWPPSPVYYNGRFSNGPVWVELLAKEYSSRLFNFAYGGATVDNADVRGFSGPTSNIPVPSATDQIRSEYIPLYKFNPQSFTPSTTLYTIWAGGNDYFFNPSITPLQVATNLIEAVQTLIENVEATKISVLNLPPVEKLPYFTGKPAEIVSGFAQKVREHNGNLTLLVEKLNKEEKKVKVSVEVIDVYEIVGKVFQNPEKYGFTEIVKPCFDGVGDVCTEPGKYFWWDLFHFSTKAHDIIAENIKVKMNGGDGNSGEPKEAKDSSVVTNSYDRMVRPSMFMGVFSMVLAIVMNCMI